MAVLPRLLVILIALYEVIATGEVSRVEKPRREIRQSAQSDEGLFGVASVAGITSRNGRISSLGGIQFYPAMKSVKVTNNGATLFYPSAKNDESKYTKGSIEIQPGSILVSSVASSRIGQDLEPLPLSLNMGKPVKPTLKEFMIQPLPDFFEKTRSFQTVEPWFMRNMFTYNPPKYDRFDDWMYPNFNQLFNFWR